MAQRSFKMKKMIMILTVASLLLFLVGCEEETTEPTSEDNGIYYGDFGITEFTYEDQSDWDQIVQNVFGSDYRVADWNDLNTFFNEGGNLLGLFDGIGLTDYDDCAFIKRNGDSSYSGTRYYFASRHEHNLPSDYTYLVHEHIDNYLISLGSWHTTKKIIAVKNDFNRAIINEIEIFHTR